MQLTSMLHWKVDTPTMTVGHLDAIYNRVCETKIAPKDGAKLIYELILEQATACLGGASGLNLENKIVLAIAIRMAAEQFMVKKIADDKFVAAITAHQTQALIDKFKAKFAPDTNAIRVLDQVALMTPENIHVNAFMYEPIVDMSDDHLRKLCTDVVALA
jgi:hypothetical protein